MNSENLVIPFQINDSIKGTIVRLSTVASKIINGFDKNTLNKIEFYGVCGDRMKGLKISK